MHPLEPVQVAGIASNLVFVPLALWVLLVGRREWGNVAFAAHVLAFGAVVAAHNVRIGTHVLEGTGILEWGEAALYLVVSASLGVLALRLPTPVTRRDLPRAVLAAALGVGFSTLSSEPSVWTVFVATTWATLFFIATRWHSYTTQHARSGAALASAALALFLSFQAGASTIQATGFHPWGTTKAAMPFLLTGLWLWNAARGGGRPAILAAWAVLGAFLAGMVESAIAATVEDLWGYTILRVASAVLLAYAIVRHQVLGADLKLRFAISKSTIAAVFIAVFFVVSEAAQQFFGEQFESGYLGILAAGALVFAIAPLSRVADRLAERAVPAASATAATASIAGGRDEAYRGALRAALRDRVLTSEEELSLAHLSDELGLTHRRAKEIRLDVERDLAEERRGAAP